jgi:glycosyltransferase involved in cell wall biosynthesis
MDEMKNSVEDKKHLAPQVSVIIPFHGSKDDLLICLNGLKKQKTNINFEVIVVENGNLHSLKSDLHSLHNVKLKSSKEVMYPGKARNIGAASSSSNILAFTDADCVPSPNWISEIFKSIMKGNKIVIGPVTNLYPLHPIASVDNLLQFPDFQKYRTSNKIAHFPGCNFGMTRVLFNKTEGFPEDVVTGEDVKFSESAIRICEDKISFNTKLIVQHGGRKNIKSFMNHNDSLGFHRGYLNLKISSSRNKYRYTFLYAFLFGIKRLIYISIRTLQWNPLGLFRIVFYFPLVILGLSAWVIGFWRGNQKFLEEQN